MDEMWVSQDCQDQLVEALQVWSTDKDEVEMTLPVLLPISWISAFIKANKLIHSLYISPTPSSGREKRKHAAGSHKGWRVLMKCRHF